MKSDPQVKSDITAELAGDPAVDATDVGVAGWLTLEGEVDWGYQSASAEQCVHPLVGATRVVDRLQLA